MIYLFLIHHIHGLFLFYINILFIRSLVNLKFMMCYLWKQQQQKNCIAFDVVVLQQFSYSIMVLWLWCTWNIFLYIPIWIISIIIYIKVVLYSFETHCCSSLYYWIYFAKRFFPLCLLVLLHHGYYMFLRNTHKQNSIYR